MKSHKIYVCVCERKRHSSKIYLSTNFMLNPLRPKFTKTLKRERESK